MMGLFPGGGGLEFWLPAGLNGVRKIGEGGVKAPSGAPSGKSEQGSRTTGNCRQLVLSEQIFREKEVDWAPRQSRIRLPLTMFAVIQRTGVDETTSK